MPSLLRRVVAEALGTFGFVFIGVAVVVANGLPGGGYGLLGVALGHALAFAILVSATMNISGGHLNPAVTVGLLTVGKISARDAVAYVAAQLGSALVAAWLVMQLLPPDLVQASLLGTPQLQHGTSFGQGIAIEVVLTFLLMTAVMGTAVAKSSPAIGGFGIGLTLVFDILVGGNLTGAAMNPARAFGPAVASGTLLSHAVYWIGPIVGAVIAAVIWKWLTTEEPA